MSLSERLKNTRELAGLARSELSALAGRSSGFVRHVEEELRDNPGVEGIDAVARVLGVSLDYLVRGEGEPPTEQEVKAAVARAQRRTRRLETRPNKPAKPAA